MLFLALSICVTAVLVWVTVTSRHVSFPPFTATSTGSLKLPPCSNIFNGLLLITHRILYPIYTKINSKWIADLKVRAKNYKISRGNLQDLRLIKDFLDKNN